MDSKLDNREAGDLWETGYKIRGNQDEYKQLSSYWIILS